MNPLVSIIILNWNGWQDTLECLESLYQINYPNYHVILVDNNSQDESLEKIRKYCQGQITIKSPFYNYQTQNKPIKIFEITNQEAGKLSKELTEKTSPEKNTTYNVSTIKNTPSKTPTIKNTITLIKNDKNYGFAPGNNIAIKYTLKKDNPDYIFLLNNDTVVDPDFLSKLVQNAGKDQQIGIVGPLIYYYNWEGRTDMAANLGGKVDISKYPGYYDLTETNSLKDFPGDIVKCDWVSGAALLLKVRDVPIKLLNEKLFFGCEDIDLALNLKEHGYNSVVALDSSIWHKEGVSRKKRSSEGAKRALMEIRSNLTFLKAHNNHFYWYLPLYLFQIFILYSRIILKID